MPIFTTGCNESSNENDVLRLDYWYLTAFTMIFLLFFASKYRGKILRKEFPHLKEFCDDHLWAPSCYHGYVGNGWEVVENDISGQDTHHWKR
jgi:hypothetical protein